MAVERIYINAYKEALIPLSQGIEAAPSPCDILRGIQSHLRLRYAQGF